MGTAISPEEKIEKRRVQLEKNRAASMKIVGKALAIVRIHGHNGEILSANLAFPSKEPADDLRGILGMAMNVPKFTAPASLWQSLPKQEKKWSHVTYYMTHPTLDIRPDPEVVKLIEATAKEKDIPFYDVSLPLGIGAETGIRGNIIYDAIKSKGDDPAKKHERALSNLSALAGITIAPADCNTGGKAMTIRLTNSNPTIHTALRRLDGLQPKGVVITLGSRAIIFADTDKSATGVDRIINWLAGLSLDTQERAAGAAR